MPDPTTQSLADRVSPCAWRNGGGKTVCFCKHPSKNGGHQGAPTKYEECLDCPLFEELIQGRQAWDKTPPVLFGPGTELKTLLSYLGISAKPSCSCNRHAEEMDAKGPEWCRKNLETVVGWLRDEAKKQSVKLYTDLVARRIVNMAIRRAEKKQSALLSQVP